MEHLFWLGAKILGKSKRKGCKKPRANPKGGSTAPESPFLGRSYHSNSSRVRLLKNTAYNQDSHVIIPGPSHHPLPFGFGGQGAIGPEVTVMQ